MPLLFVDKDFDDPFEHADEKGVAFAGVDLRFAFGFDRILPFLPLEYFEGNEIEVQAFLEFRGVRILDECDGALSRFCDVGGWIDLASQAAGKSDVWMVRRQFRCGDDTDAFDRNICFVLFHWFFQFSPQTALFARVYSASSMPSASRCFSESTKVVLCFL